jgi:iron complex transport system ATP-binding protein
MRVQVDHVCWSVDNREILHQADLNIEAGSFIGLVGPNGCGKSTLLRCIYRLLKPDSGEINLDGENVWRISAREAARRTAVVLQEYPTEFEFTVEEIVSMGRNPHKNMFDRETPEDLQIIEQALDQVDMTRFASRSFRTLSGGEKQRVMIARTLTQQAQFLILDEPTNHLDIRYQLETMDLVKSLGITTLAALHDLNIATSYCDGIYVMNDGVIVAAGPPEDVLQPELIHDVFGVGATVDRHPQTGKARINFYLDGTNARRLRSLPSQSP